MKVEIWFDIVCKTEHRYEILFTVFANHEMSAQPNLNETIHFHQKKGSNLKFKQFSPIGPVNQTIVSVTVEDVSHYSINENGMNSFKTALRCGEFPVVSRDDAIIVQDILTNQCGFEVAPYSINKLNQ